jgi:hypothetical protein
VRHFGWRCSDVGSLSCCRLFQRDRERGGERPNLVTLEAFDTMAVEIVRDRDARLTRGNYGLRRSRPLQNDLTRGSLPSGTKVPDGGVLPVQSQE